HSRPARIGSRGDGGASGTPMEMAALGAGFSPVIIAKSRLRFRKSGRAAEGTASRFYSSAYTARIQFTSGEVSMPDSLIDLKALLVEREDCDAGTVQQLRNGLAQGGSQYRALRDVADVLKKKIESASGPAAKRLHLKLGIAQFFLGHLVDSIENLKQAEGALSSFYLGRALASKHDYDEALKAFDKAEKTGYTASQVNLQRAGIYRQKG